MCGVVGCTDLDGEQLTNDLRRMVPLMAHRGPDGSGIWVDREHGIGFGHARLAIIDLSPEGHQPKVSRTGRYVITFNGEVFNFQELAKELLEAGHTFIGSGDTEVMLAAFEQWGIALATRRFVGMFAFAVWDRRDHALTIVRDRFGIKPLYYGWYPDGGFCFASDVRVLRASSRWRGNLDRAALAQMVRYGYVPSPASIFEGVWKLPPGTMLTVGGDSLFTKPGPFSSYPQDGVGVSPIPYWSAKEGVQRGKNQLFRGSFDEAVVEYERLLTQAIKLRMVADVPLGAFLSGGIDSSLVVAVMQRLSSQPVRTFCIGSHDPDFDESGAARRVAESLGTAHTELLLTESDLLGVVEKLPLIFDEPFGDSSQIPTYLVSQLARSQVTVSLSGDGGDEMFCGYSRFQFTASYWRNIAAVPRGIRSVARPLRAVIPPVVESLGMYRLASRLDRALQLLPSPSFSELYDCVLGCWERDSEVVAGIKEIHDIVPRSNPGAWDRETFLMYTDTTTYLPDDILTKVDRASMAVSLEARVPLLDHRLAEFVWELPTEFKIDSHGTTKRLMRELLYRYVPRELVDRPKKGFSIPVHHWLRTTLKEWSYDLLSPAALKREGVFNAEVVARYLGDHMSGKRNRDAALWNILQAQSWLASISAAPAALRKGSDPTVTVSAPYEGGGSGNPLSQG
jgi:asparagine synthase (glutamine-hydrolysing)